MDLLALALAAGFRTVDARAALAELDALGEELAGAADGTPHEQVRACGAVLGGVHGFSGDEEGYDLPRNSMFDEVLRRRRGLPISLSVVYVEVARRAGIPLAGVGLPGHFVVRHLGQDSPLLLDPFTPNAPIAAAMPPMMVRPWSATEIAMRMLNNLFRAYQRRGNLPMTLRAAEMRLDLPAPAPLRIKLEAELGNLRASLN